MRSQRVTRFSFLLIAAAVLGTVAACTSPARPAVTPQLRTAEAEPGRGVTAVSVTGLPEAALERLAASGTSAEAFARVLRVQTTEAPAGAPAVSGRYAVRDGVLRFEPAFPLDPHVAHTATFDPRELAGVDLTREPWATTPLTLTIAAAGRTGRPSTRVVQMFPPAEMLENQLRVYLQFSAPMSRRPARDFVRLLDDAGREVPDAFLPLDVSLWNDDRTRCTLLFDPGRVKRGILPNAEMGRPLTAGRRYTVVVSRAWPDATDQPLVEEFRREFRVRPAVLSAIEPGAWRVVAPAANTRDALVVTFPHALDYALAARAIRIEALDGAEMPGEVQVADTATEWRFLPAAPWQPGRFQLRALAVLEDAAGNRVGRPFDADPSIVGSITADAPAGADATVPFAIR
ncbi:MAG: hypothetical protein AB7P67_09290 [Vicinamibacterales bacterium]